MRCVRKIWPLQLRVDSDDAMVACVTDKLLAILYKFGILFALAAQNCRPLELIIARYLSKHIRFVGGVFHFGAFVCLDAILASCRYFERVSVDSKHGFSFLMKVFPCQLLTFNKFDTDPLHHPNSLSPFVSAEELFQFSFELSSSWRR